MAVELKQYDDARALYEQCLELDPNDQRAAAELKGLPRLHASGGAGESVMWPQ
ncbi:MAG: hypothetical protein GAK40_00429 [Burkholderia plantarii]|nr:MAG: hypothetical protein GAK40_00429 [Burkholderia plantarii]